MAYGYLENVAIAIDQLCNTVVGGSADETISARCHRMQHKQPWKLLRTIVDRLFFWQANHCQEAWKSEMLRAQLPKSYREKE